MRTIAMSLLWFAAPLTAQQETWADVEDHVRWSMDRDGDLLWIASPGAEPREIDIRELFASTGVAGWVTVALPPDCDLASLTDAELALRRLGSASDAEVVSLISGERGDLLRVLAIRVAQDRKLEDAIPALREQADANGDEPIVRRAATEALAAIEGESVEPIALPPLAEDLDVVPEDAPFVFVFDHRNMPSTRGLVAFHRRNSAAETQQWVADHVHDPSSDGPWLDVLREAVLHSEAAPLLTLTLVHEGGNVRALRTVSAFDRLDLAMLGGFSDTDFRSRLWYDPEKFARLLDGAGIDLGPALLDGRFIEMRTPGARIDDASRERLAERVDPEAAITLLIRGEPGPGARPAVLEGIERVSVHFPANWDGPLRIVADAVAEADAERLATLVAGGLAQLKALAEVDPSIGVALEFLEGLDVETDGARVSLTLPFDLERFARLYRDHRL